jgi:hypothetical protein
VSGGRVHPTRTTRRRQDFKGTAMQRFFCDACNKELRAGADRRYVVRMEARRVDEADAKLTDADLDGQDDPDHIDAMDELLAAADDDTELEPPPTAPEPVEYDLCDGCYARFHADPLGLDRARNKLFFSAN